MTVACCIVIAVIGSGPPGPLLIPEGGMSCWDCRNPAKVWKTLASTMWPDHAETASKPVHSNRQQRLRSPTERSHAGRQK